MTGIWVVGLGDDRACSSAQGSILDAVNPPAGPVKHVWSMKDLRHSDQRSVSGEVAGVRSGPAHRYPSEGEHLVASVRIPDPRAGDHESIPAWPDTLIEPTNDELVRWFQLWTAPQASTWAQTEQQHAVAALVRLEERCCQPRPPSANYVAELDHLRHELGLCQ